MSYRSWKVKDFRFDLGVYVGWETGFFTNINDIASKYNIILIKSYSLTSGVNSLTYTDKQTEVIRTAKKPNLLALLRRNFREMTFEES